MKHQIIFPMLIYVLYIGFAAVYMFVNRLNAIKSGRLSLKYFKTNVSTVEPPEKALVAARHFDNQFQVPMLFFVGGALHFAVGMVDSLTLALAWAFVFSRLGHAWIHLRSNNVLKRATFFVVGLLLVILMWIQLGYFAFMSGF